MMKELKESIKQLGPCRPETVMYAAALLLNAFFGVFVEAVGCLTAALLGAAALISLKRQPRPALYKTLWAAGFAAVCFFYLFTVLYAVDRGYAFLGFVKFMPLALGAFLCMQFSAGQREALLHAVPAVGLAQLVFALPAWFVPALKGWFFTYGRFHGGFGYSNVYALFCLCGMLALLLSPLPLKLPFRLAPALLLLGGVLLSGSRTAFLLAAPALLFVVLKEKRLRLPLGVSAAVVIGLAAVYGLVSGNIGSIARFLNFSISESSYIDRLLYYYDALPLILRHPFGLGYKGYTFIVPSVQTGLYSVTFAHNEYLQFMLDVGVLPAGLFFAGLAKTFFEPVPLRNKLLLGAILLHCAVDFDLQFLSVLLMLPLLCAYPEKKRLASGGRKKKESKALRTASAAFAAVCVLAGGYLAAAASLEAAGSNAAAVKLYPGFTMAQVRLLREEAAAEQQAAADRAERILKNNKYIAVAYDVLAASAAAQDDYDKALILKNKALDCAPFEKSEYLDLFSVLYNAVQYADRQHDIPLLKKYCTAMAKLPERMQGVLDGMSALGRKITDQPDLTLPQEYADYIAKVSASLEG